MISFPVRTLEACWKTGWSGEMPYSGMAASGTALAAREAAADGQIAPVPRTDAAPRRPS